jgi:hypothetical protein
MPSVWELSLLSPFSPSGAPLVVTATTFFFLDEGRFFADRFDVGWAGVGVGVCFAPASGSPSSAVSSFGGLPCFVGLGAPNIPKKSSVLAAALGEPLPLRASVVADAEALVFFFSAEAAESWKGYRARDRDRDRDGRWWCVSVGLGVVDQATIHTLGIGLRLRKRWLHQDLALCNAVEDEEELYLCICLDRVDRRI